MIINNFNISEQANKLAKFEYTINYDDINRLVLENDNNQIIICNNVIDNNIEMSIRFKEMNKNFDIPWIYLIDTGKKLDKLQKNEIIETLVNYISDNYHKVSDVAFCENKISQVSKYISDHLADMINNEINSL